MVGGGTLVTGAFLSSSWSLLQAPSPCPGHAAALSQPWAPEWAPVPWCHPQEGLVHRPARYAGVAWVPLAQSVRDDTHGPGHCSPCWL